MRFRRMSWVVKILGSIFIAGFILIGGYFFFTGIRETVTAIQSRTWPTVPGTVILSRVLERQGSGEGALSSYYADIAFSYQVNGKSYTTGRVSLSDLITSDRKYHDEIAAKYPVGQDVTVFYSPKEPNRGILEPGFTADLLIPLVVGGVIFFLGLGMLYGWIRMIQIGDKAGELTIQDAFQRPE